MILQRKLQVCDYTIPMKGLAPGSRITLCQVSDVHSEAFGDYSDQVVSAIQSRVADAILFTGDLMDCRRDEMGKFFFRLLDRLPKVPMIASPGNHEKRLGRAWGEKWTFVEEITRRGIRYLDNDHVTLTLQGQEVAVYGFIQPFRTFVVGSEKKNARLVQEMTAGEITELLGPCPEGPVVLMAHDPVLFEAYAEWGAPLVLSGHIHGGVVRLPVLGGLLSPARKFFPPYDSGLYEKNGTKMLVSRGMCAPMFPRINNAPDIAFITLVGAEN